MKKNTSVFQQNGGICEVSRRAAPPSHSQSLQGVAGYFASSSQRSRSVTKISVDAAAGPARVGTGEAPPRAVHGLYGTGGHSLVGDGHCPGAAHRPLPASHHPVTIVRTVATPILRSLAVALRRCRSCRPCSGASSRPQIGGRANAWRESSGASIDVSACCSTPRCEAALC